MRPFTDKPYRFFPPKYKPFAAKLLRAYLRHHVLPHKQRIRAVETVGGEGLGRLHESGDRLLFLPNHPTHADGAILIEALRQRGLRTSIMAAYDVFLRGSWVAWVMQSLGGFSVDRECCDRRALSQAEATLVEGRLALTIFPEGHVYLQNDEVTPFCEGAIFIGLTAARRLAKEGQRVVAVPVSIKATYVDDVRSLLVERLRTVAREVGVRLEPNMTPRAALRAIGLEALARNLRNRSIPFSGQGSLATNLREAAQSVLDSLDEKIQCGPDPERSPMDRIRHARRVAHEVLIDPAREVDHAAARLWSDEATLAWRIASYSGEYVAGRPSLDRIAETLEKIEEDAFSRFVTPLAERVASVRFGPALDLGGAVGGGKGLRAAVQEVTCTMEAAVQTGLDELNRHSTHVGSDLWNEPLGCALSGDALD